jgi:hypothetical protein
MIVKMAVFHNGGGRLLILPPVATSNSEKASWNILSWRSKWKTDEGGKEGGRSVT